MIKLGEGLIGKQVNVILKENKNLKGYCCEYTQALDNEPEISSICIIKELGDLSSIELYEDEIKEIQIM